MGWLSTGAGLLSSFMDSIRNERLLELVKPFLEESPDVPVSREIFELLKSWQTAGKSYNVILSNIDQGTYVANRELLVGDCLASIGYLYADRDFVSIENKRMRKPGEVIEGLTTLLLDNWKHVGDKMKHDMELYLAYAVYMANKVAERTHEPFAQGGEPITMLYPMRIMIVLDCIARLERLNVTSGIKVFKPRFSTYGDDEIAHIRSKLKPPKSNWSRGEYDWSKDSSCWIVTAYYGNPYHPSVESIKALRAYLMSLPVVGQGVAQINGVYQRVGEASFGRWWVTKLSDSHTNFPKLLSRLICYALLMSSRVVDRTGADKHPS